MEKVGIKGRIAALIAGVAVLVSGVVALAPGATAAGTGCAGGWVCIFRFKGNSNGHERAFQFSNSDLRTQVWGIYRNGQYVMQPGETIVGFDAMNNQFRIDNLTLYSSANYRGDQRTFLPRSGYWVAPAASANIGSGGPSGSWIDYGVIRSIRAH